MGKRQLVIHQQSKLLYILTETPEGVYLSANDGVVPSGQLLGSKTIETALRDNPVLSKTIGVK